MFCFFFRSVGFVVQLEKPVLHIGIWARLDLGEGLDGLVFLQAVRAHIVISLVVLDEGLHVLVSQIAVGLLAFLLLDLTQDDGEGGILAAELHHFLVLGGVEDAGGLVELLGDGDGGGDEVDGVVRVLGHCSVLSAVCRLGRCRRDLIALSTL